MIQAGTVRTMVLLILYDEHISQILQYRNKMLSAGWQKYDSHQSDRQSYAIFVPYFIYVPAPAVLSCTL